MIKARPGLKAVYKFKGGNHKARTVEIGGVAVELADGEYTSARQSIVAFDDDGDALVLEGRELVLAKRFSNFVGIKEEPQVVQLIAADGWLVWRVDGDGTAWSTPLVAWGLRSDGSVVALDTDDSGWVEPVEENFEGIIRHSSKGQPDEWIVAQREKLKLGSAAHG